MPDLIKLLPDSVANQIAAGEVVQRPASAVKELMENAIDSGAAEVKLIIRDAGKTLIQVIDNGCGMSERDARMCFEPHATSKITNANDLLSIHTLGFRGEALASIASVAQVELKTRRIEDEVGTSIIIEGSEFKGQSPVACPAGTSIAVKNLFFNVPARRNFLKSNNLELKYIIEEFFRIALVNPGIGFIFHNNNKLLYQLLPSNLKQRLVALYGASYNERLVPVEQESTIVNIKGYIGKPEYARKTRGEQYFFTNGRYIRNPYLHHALENAFRELIPPDAFPSYFIYMNLDPQQIDVNIHPTKTEINFQDIKSIYSILHSAVRQGIGKYNITPTLDFETEHGLDVPPLPEGAPVKPPVIHIDPSYNPFEKKVRPQTEIPFSNKFQSGDKGWKKLFESLNEVSVQAPEAVQHEMEGIGKEEARDISVLQLQNRYLVTTLRRGVMIIDQVHATERILYERFLFSSVNPQPVSQQQLLPENISLSHEDALLVREYAEEFEKAGFSISEFGKDTFLIQAVPSDCPNSDIAGWIDSMLESLKINQGGDKMSKNQKMARSMAKSIASRQSRKMLPEESSSLIEQLMACKVPDMTPDGKPTLMLVSLEDLEKKFK